MTPAARVRIRALVTREIEEPGDMIRFRHEMENAFPDLEPLLRLLAIKDEEHRTSFYVKSESVWYRRFGFRIMRPLFLVATLAAVGFSLQDAVDPALGLACFGAGAFALYVTLQVFAHRWSRKDLHKLDEARDRYRQRLQRLLDEIEQPRS